MGEQIPLEIPRAGRVRPQDRLSYLFSSLLSIWRNKRRSMSMIAGLILGISIMAGILLYTTVLMNNVYDTVIEGSPYEIRMDFRGEITDAQIERLKEDFTSNPKISDAQLIYGDARTIVETTATSTSMYTLADLDADFIVEYSNQTFSDSQGIIFSSNFYSGEIGTRLREQLITGSNPGVYSTDSPYYHGIFISESLAETARVQQGNILSQLTLVIRKQDPDDFFSRTLVDDVTLENITIAGIIASDIGASAGLFSEAILGVSGVTYIPEELFSDQNQTQFLESLEENEMRYAVLKINEKEFNLENPQTVNSQINQLINEYEKEYSELIGSNLVENQLLPFQVLSIFIFIFDGVLTIPVAILSLYLLSFGIDLSLHERKYQVGILKTQGASPKQIKRKILMEAFFLAAVGLIIGYFVAIFGAWGIGTATGFMKWNWDYALTELPDFFYFDETAFFIVGGLVVIILFLMVNGKSNTFIEMEIVESVRRAEETKSPNFLRRNNLDIIFFIIGLLVLILVILGEFGITLNLGPFAFFLALLGPPFFWIGGAAVVARLAVWIPPKMDPIIRKISFLKDVSLLIKGNVFRKSGDIPRLSLIIALTVSFSILAAVQGKTGEVHQERLITFDIGADISVATGQNLSTTIIDNIKASSNDIKEVMALSSTSGLLLNDPVTIFSVDSEKYASVGKWQSDSIPTGEPNKDRILANLTNDPNGCLMGKSILKEKSLEIGEKITLEFLTYYWNGSTVNFGYRSQNITIHGIFDHAPGSIGATGIIVDNSLINKVSNITALAESLDILPPEILQIIPISLKNQLKGDTDDPKAILASRFLVQVNTGANVESIKTALMNPENEWIISVTTLKEEIRKANEIQNMDFGIPGLLTADFVISLLAATLATFIFMSILMEQRKKEFAILQSYGASQRQIYKVVFSETIVLLLTSVVWGLFIGIGLSILFNGFFEFMDVFITPLSTIIAGGPINRVLIFDWVGLLGTISITFVAMLIATFLSARGSAKAKISEVVREL
ncbi:MAG: FtsX-like permease family protein [Candidatus Hodarchaeota archaeon]